MTSAKEEEQQQRPLVGRACSMISFFAPCSNGNLLECPARANLSYTLQYLLSNDAPLSHFCCAPTRHLRYQLLLRKKEGRGRLPGTNDLVIYICLLFFTMDQDFLETKHTDVTEHWDDDDDDEDEEQDGDDFDVDNQDNHSTFRDEGNVDNDDDDAPQALWKDPITQQVTIATANRYFWPRHQRYTRMGAMIVVLLVVVVVVVVILVRQQQDKDKNTIVTDDYYEFAKDNNNENPLPDVFDASPSPPSPPNHQPPSSSRYKAFVDTAELVAAVDAYVQQQQQQQQHETSRMPESSTVAQTYGWPIGSWDISRLTTLDHVFDGTSSRLGAVRNATALALFNEPLQDWDTRRIVSMASTFAGCLQFNQPLHAWDVSRVTNFELMFHNAHSFNGDISNWQTTSATNVWSMFDSAYAFNQDLSGWDVSRITTFHSMFWAATAFRQDLCPWGERIRSDTRRSLSDMFTWADACPASGTSPNLNASPPGPFCFSCS